MGSRVELVENRLILYQTYFTPSFSLRVCLDRTYFAETEN